VKALAVGVVSVLLWDGTVVDQSLNGAFLPTVHEVDVPVLVVSIALTVRTNASGAQLVLKVCAIVVKNANKKLQLWETHRKITRTWPSHFAIGCVPHVIDVVVLVAKFLSVPATGHPQGNSDEVAFASRKVKEGPFLTQLIVVGEHAALGHHPARRAWVRRGIVSNHPKAWWVSYSGW